MYNLKKGFFVTLTAVILTSVVWRQMQPNRHQQLLRQRQRKLNPLHRQHQHLNRLPHNHLRLNRQHNQPLRQHLLQPKSKPSDSSGQPVTPPAAAETKPAEALAAPQFPYTAEIVGTEVYVRSGPGTAYYQCGKLSAPSG